MSLADADTVRLVLAASGDLLGGHTICAACDHLRGQRRIKEYLYASDATLGGLANPPIASGRPNAHARSHAVLLALKRLAEHRPALSTSSGDTA